MASDEFQRWARFGVDQDGVKYIPVGGACLIVYLLSRKEDSLLVGKVNGKDQAEYWNDEAIYLKRPNIWVGKWFVPCGFMHFGEDPLDRAKTLIEENLNGSSKSIDLIDVVSYTEKSDYYPGYNHWHLDFMYNVVSLKLGAKPEWWDSLEYVPINKLRASQIGMAGDQPLKRMGILR